MAAWVVLSERQKEELNKRNGETEGDERRWERTGRCRCLAVLRSSVPLVQSCLSSWRSIQVHEFIEAEQHTHQRRQRLGIQAVVAGAGGLQLGAERIQVGGRRR